MQWRDFFYFSKGERQALLLLLILILITFLFRIFYYSSSEYESKVSDNRVIPPEIIYPDKQSSTDTVSVKPGSGIPAVKDSSKSWRTVPQSGYNTKKYPKGTLVDLNKADTLILQKVPGIGPAFANRIVKYRNLLGGFIAVEQLQEVYGIDEDRYDKLKSWFKIDMLDIGKIYVNKADEELLRKHPYINYRQARAMIKYRKQKGRIEGWENFVLLDEFSEEDINRLKAYIEFE